MFSIFSSREIAIGIYLLIFISYGLIKTKIRQSFFKVVKAACSVKLVIPFMIMLTYAILHIYILSFVKFWEWKYLKDIIMWFLFVGVPICYNAIGEKVDNKYFINMIVDNIKLAALVEFIISSFTFSLIVEMILQIGMFFLFLMQAIAKTKDEYKDTKKIIDSLIIIISILVIVFTINKAIETYAEQGIIDYIVSFCIPIIFSLTYVPVAYFMAIYSSYETLFVHMSFKEPKDTKIIRKHRFAVIKACKLSFTKIYKFKTKYMPKMYVRMYEKEFEDLIQEFSNIIV